MNNICKRPPYQKATKEMRSLDKRLQAYVRTLPCANCGSEGEYVEKYGRCFCESAHVALDGVAGKAYKGLLSVIPLCRTCHFISHQKGHLALRPREWWIEQKDKYLHRFLQLVR